MLLTSSCMSQSSSSEAPIRDHLYQEGIILADFVVNEFITSEAVFNVLHKNKQLRSKLHQALRAEISDHRQRCLAALEQCEFIDNTPKTEDGSGLQRLVSSSQAAVTPPSPSEISRSVLDLLKNQPLSSQTFVARPRSAHSVELAPSAPSPPPSPPTHHPPEPKKQKPLSAAKYLARSGLFSGLVIPEDTPLDSSDDSNPLPQPPTPTELSLKPEKILESAFPIELFGVLDKDKLDQHNLSRKKGKSKRMFAKKRRSPEGFFQKDGSYHAMVYGGFIHLCGGALEWPFRSAEVAFVDFFDTPAKAVGDVTDQIKIQL